MTVSARSERCEPWMGVEFRHLAALDAIAREGSFRGAAARLGYVQSAVSQQIAYLERVIGVQLVERSRGPQPVRVTAAGRVLLSHTDCILSRLRAARADLDAMTGGLDERVRVGVEPTVIRRLLPGVLTELATERPDIDVVPVDVTDEPDRLALVERGDLDAAFVDLPVTDGPFDTVELIADPFVLLVPADDALAALGREPSLQEVARCQLLGRSAERIAGIGKLAVEGDDCAIADSVVQALVVAGRGVAVIPRLAVDEHQPTVALELRELVPPRTVGLCWHRDRSVRQPLDAFLRAAERSLCDRTGRLRS